MPFVQHTVAQRSPLVPLKKTADWYVNWAQKFAISIKGKKLRSRSVKDIGGFLNGLEAQKGVEPWQVDQARKAVIFLYGISLSSA